MHRARVTADLGVSALVLGIAVGREGSRQIRCSAIRSLRGLAFGFDESGVCVLHVLGIAGLLPTGMLSASSHATEH